MKTHNIINRYNLNLANSFIEDDVPTLALEVDVNDEVFNSNLSEIWEILK